MRNVIRCDCGYEVMGKSDDELVAGAQAHAWATHRTEVSADAVLALARPHQRPRSETPEEEA